MLLLGAVASLYYAISGATLAAWATLLAFLVVVLLIGGLLRPTRLLQKTVVAALVAGFGSAIPVLIAQMEAQFADEEFFVALEMIVFAVFVLGLWISDRLVSRCLSRGSSGGIRFQRAPVLVLATLAVFFVGCLAIRGYRHSFYVASAPAYPGIDLSAPFLCNETPGDDTVYDGAEVFARLLARVEANPRKESPEYGMLALATGKRPWAEQFRSNILREASEGLFTEPANSVKYGQYQASQRAYYFPRVRDAYPNLFSEQEIAQLNDWFADINERALTVGWVDALYGVAFSKWPEGPYENQESGAGLLALLESHNLAAPHLRDANQDYLLRNQRGWTERFRNTDDALVYQLEWINNAYFQSLYQEDCSELNQMYSFEWLLLQSLPDGDRLGYNHPAHPSLVGVAYLGATLLEDPRYVWLAGRSLDALEAQDGYLGAQPGVESPVDLLGRSPTDGSCLLYGNSGLPNQRGPLAPDKIVLRDGWKGDALYAMLNLRFAGWHRYKATNTVSLVYKGEPVIQEVATGEPFSWVPVGRSLFRDKRIPRENLNGLLIPRSGLSGALGTVTGVGSPWAQDPPHYAAVKDVQIGDEVSYVHTRTSNWHRWQHDRQMYLYHGEGPLVILDTASGPRNEAASLSWHLPEGEEVGNRRFRLGEQNSFVEVVWLPWGAQGDLLSNRRTDGSLFVRCEGVAGGVDWITVVLQGQWVGAEVALDMEADVLSIGSMAVPLTVRDSDID
ncbi:MAG: hypothetical protein ACP5HS_03800 [Anaerolineae bacterium]